MRWINSCHLSLYTYQIICSLVCIIHYSSLIEFTSTYEVPDIWGEQSTERIHIHIIQIILPKIKE